MEIVFNLDKTAKINSWKVKEGRRIFGGNIIFDYCECNSDGVEINQNARLKFKSPQGGVVREILAPEGSVVTKGTPLATVAKNEVCAHPVVIDDMCGVCSMDLRKLDDPPSSKATVAMVHSIPALKVSMEDAQLLGKLDEQHLTDKKVRKLVLLVDLDQTLIHTTNDNVPHNLENVFHFQLRSHGPLWYHTRLRPGTREFLEKINKLFQLHICTFGTRQYANIIAMHLDPEKKYFSDRILSRDECFSANSKTANLKELFPRGDHMVCIIDDREDVWNFAPNLIHVKPYHFFRHTGDINAPPGLSKADNDDKEGFEFPSEPGKKTSETATGAGEKETAETKDEVAVDTENQVAANEEDKIVETSAEETSGSKEEATPEVAEEKIKTEVPAHTGDSDNEKETSTKDADCTSIHSNALPAERNEGGADTVPSTNPEKVASAEVMESEDVPSEGSGEVTENANDSDPVPTSVDASDSPVDDNTASKTEDLQAGKEEGELESNSSCDSPKTSSVTKVEDPDDYLLYLETILTKIHQAYYDLYDEMTRTGQSGVPDVKNVIPYVRKKVLKGTSIVFSGVIPTHIPLEKSKPFSIATSLGANVTTHIIPPAKPGSKSKELPTTHLVAAKDGTAKVNDAKKRYKGIHIVTPDWLWQCAERWEWCEEKLFSLLKESKVKRYPPAHCSSPNRSDTDSQHKSPGPSGAPSARKERTPSGRFIDTINPLLTFSVDDLESMDHEVDDIFNESDSSSSSNSEEAPKVRERVPPKRKRSRASESSTPPISHHPNKKSNGNTSSESTIESDTDDDTEDERRLLGKRKRSNTRTETETEDEPLSARFRRGEPLPSDLDTLNLLTGSSDEENGGANGSEQEDDWMAQALEREFLNEDSQNSLL